MWTEEYQVDLLAEHFEAFDLLRSEYKWFIGEMIWNFADFKTAQSNNEKKKYEEFCYTFFNSFQFNFQ